MQFVLTASDFTSTTFYIHNCTLFLLWLCLFILSGVTSLLFSSSILGTYPPWEFIFQCHIILHFHTVLRVLKARVLKCFAIPSPGDHILSELATISNPFWVAVAYSFIELDKAVIGWSV